LSRIAACMETLKSQGRKALIPYIVAGDPNPGFTVPMMHQLVEQGADILELGVPFSDPMAEGPVIQLAHERALLHNVSLRSVLEMVKEFRQQDQQTPVVLMGYANPVQIIGYPALAELAATAGVDGFLVVDMPPEEAVELSAALRAVDIDNIFLIAPTTTEQRIKKIADMATGYLYYVSLKGVTGAGHLDIDSVALMLDKIRAITSLPVTVGFGIKDADTAQSVSRLAEGVVVGSALVNRVVELASEDQSQRIIQSAQLIGGMRQAIDTA
jgi:tryptophan synthase alpha chain